VQAQSTASLGHVPAIVRVCTSTLRWHRASSARSAAVTVLAVTVALALAPLIGPLGGGLVAVLMAGGVAALLGWLSLQRLKAGR